MSWTPSASSSPVRSSWSGRAAIAWWRWSRCTRPWAAGGRPRARDRFGDAVIAAHAAVARGPGPPAGLARWPWLITVNCGLVGYVAAGSGMALQFDLIVQDLISDRWRY